MKSNRRCSAVLLTTLGVALAVPGVAQTNNISFRARRDFPATGHAGGIVAGDFRGTGVKDLVIPNTAAVSTSLSLVPNNGDGTFGAPVAFNTGGNKPSAVAVADMNNDGKLDVVVTNELSNTVAILLGSGNGRFQSAHVFPVGVNPVAVAVGDFNGDGKTDVAVANSTSNTVSILLGRGDGTLGAATSSSVGIRPSSLVVGKFHGGTASDIVVANAGNNDQRNGTVSLLTGNGNGTFRPATTLLSNGNFVSVATAELSGDGNADLAIADRSLSAVLIELGNGNGTFRTSGRLLAQASLISVTAADFHGDGRQRDLVVTSGESSEVVSVFLNNGNATFLMNPKFAVSQNPAGAVAVDVNRDGRTDIVSASQLGNISVLLGLGRGLLISAASFPAGVAPTYIVTADLNGDGKLDVALASEGSNSVSILLGTGTGALGPRHDFPVGTNPFALSVGDFNGDQKPDLAVANSGHFDDDPGSISILLGNGDGTFQAPRNVRVGNIPAFVAVGDFNKDGKQDLAVANFVDNTVSILRGNGDGSFGAPSTISFPPFSQIFNVAVADIDGDHNQDLIVAGGSDVWTLKGNGLGGFGAPRLVHEGFTGIFAVGDFNGDSHPDLAIADLNQGQNGFVVDTFLGNGDGSFRTGSRASIFGAIPTQIVAGDLNRDGKLDLAVTALNNLTIDVLSGNGDGSFTPSPNANFGATTFAQSLSIGDFNADGRNDIAVTGVASNAGVGTSAGAVSLLLNTTP